MVSQEHLAGAVKRISLKGVVITRLTDDFQDLTNEQILQGISTPLTIGKSVVVVSDNLGT